MAAAKNRHIFGEQVFSGLEALSDQLGNFPVETQLAAIAHCKRLTEHFIDVHQNRYEHNIKLYRTLGFLGGTAFAILIW